MPENVTTDTVPKGRLTHSTATGLQNFSHPFGIEVGQTWTLHSGFACVPGLIQPVPSGD